ncbi:hypothetical protein GCM10008915_41140 [Bifidobacterium pullorum subsp. gallinarum]
MLYAVQQEYRSENDKQGIEAAAGFKVQGSHQGNAGESEPIRSTARVNCRVMFLSHRKLQYMGYMHM